jgi:hypothetical protein
MSPANKPEPPATPDRTVKPGGNSAFQAWLAADAMAGPQRAHRLAIRLPELMRPLGRTAVMRADWALAHSLFWRGHFAASLELLDALKPEAITPTTDTVFDHVNLALLIAAQSSWTLAALGRHAAALEQAETLLDSLQQSTTPLDCAYASHALGLLHCLLDQPEAALAWSRAAQTGAPADLNHSAIVLEYWALASLAEPTDEPAVQTALAALRRLGHAQEARAFSLYAQALFRQSPSHAGTQLDVALELNARSSLHLWDARLMQLKSRSLDAAGQLGEAERFLQLARETAHQQGVQLLLDDGAGIESRTNASPAESQP